MTATEPFRQQARACAALGSPFMARLMTLMAQELPTLDADVARRVLTWPGDPGTRGDAVPLRLAAALHALVLDGRDPALDRIWRRPAHHGDATLWSGVAAALRRWRDFILDWLERPPQTNEVGRSAALIAVARWLDQPLILSEPGASAGLNLLFDHYALETGQGRAGPEAAALTLRPRWTGLPPAPGSVHIRERAGIDLTPADPQRDRLRLMAYIWPDQPERLARMDAALRLAARQRPPVAQGDAVDWLDRRLRVAHPGALHLIYHTVFWQYLPRAAQVRATALLNDAGARATSQAPLAHFAMENDGGDGAALTLTMWPGGDSIAMGRADFHGRWVDWTPPQASGGARRPLPQR